MIRKLQTYPKYKPSGVEWLGDIPSDWDTKRNSVDLLIPKSLTVIIGEPTSETVSDSILKSDEPLGGIMDAEPVFSWEKFNQWAGYSDGVISDEEFLDNVGIDGNDIPSWIKMNNAKWVKDGVISQEELLIALKNLDSRGII